MKYLSVKDVAEIYQVHQNAIYKWVKEGQLKAIRIGRTIRFDPKDILPSGD